MPLYLPSLSSSPWTLWMRQCQKELIKYLKCHPTPEPTSYIIPYINKRRGSEYKKTLSRLLKVVIIHFTHAYTRHDSAIKWMAWNSLCKPDIDWSESKMNILLPSIDWLNGANGRSAALINHTSGSPAVKAMNADFKLLYWRWLDCLHFNSNKLTYNQSNSKKYKWNVKFLGRYIGVYS